MAAVNDDRCPRCGGGFHCGMNDAGPCPCADIALDAPLQQRLRERYRGCLCLRCLRELQAGAPLDDAGAAPSRARD
jgi:hypothetical protein